MKKKTRTIKNSIPADKKIPTEFKNTLSELVPHSVWNTQQLNNLETLYTNNRYSPLTIQRIVLNYLYMEHGLIQSLIDQPALRLSMGHAAFATATSLGDWDDFALRMRNAYQVLLESNAG